MVNSNQTVSVLDFHDSVCVLICFYVLMIFNWMKVKSAAFWGRTTLKYEVVGCLQDLQVTGPSANLLRIHKILTFST